MTHAGRLPSPASARIPSGMAPLFALLALLAISSPLHAQLMAEWRMDEPGWDGTPGEIADTSGNGHHATARTGGGMNSLPTTAPARVCNGGEFRGEGFNVPPNNQWIQARHYADTHHTPSLSPLAVTAEMTVGGWFRMSQTGGTLIHKGEGGNTQEYEIHVSGGMLRARFWDTWGSPADMVVSNTNLAVNTWYFFSVTVERLGASHNIRVTGYLFDTNGQIGSNQQNLSVDYNNKITNARVFFGAISYGGTPVNYFNGLLDEFRLYNTVRSQAEIQAHWATTRPSCPVSGGPDHIRIHHPGSGLTCSPAQIGLTACADAGCTELYEGPVTVQLTSPAGHWSPSPVTFQQTTSVALGYTSPGTVTLGAMATDPTATEPTRCFSSGTETCQMTFLDSGFVINVPDHVADTPQPGTISAVRTDDATQACVPGFSDQEKTVHFRSQYTNPASGSLTVLVNGTAAAQSSPGTPIPLNFDANGVAPLLVRYPDVGAMQLHARHEGTGPDAGLIMTGVGGFVTRPHRFVLDVPGNPGAGNAEGPVFRHAGANFPINVEALNATGNLTPNFGHEMTPEEVELEIVLHAPGGGNAPDITGTFGSFGSGCGGTAGTPGSACGQFAWPEVGIIRLNPRLASGAYLGTEDVVGTSTGNVGRFIPHHFSLSEQALVNRSNLDACDSEFTYIGETLTARFRLTARNLTGGTTGNYDGDFARLGPGDLAPGAVANGEDLSDALEIGDVDLPWAMGSALATMDLHLERTQPAGPFPDFHLGIDPADSDGVRLDALDLDVSGSGTDDHGLVDQTRLLFGRLVIDNAVGSELGPLSLPWRAEYWNGHSWLVASEENGSRDECTGLELASEVSLLSDSGAEGDGTETMPLGSASTAIVESSPVTLVNGRSGLTFSAPNAPGWIEVRLLLDERWPFLLDDLTDDGVFEDTPGARAGFGLFDGSSGRIFLQEIPPR